MMTSRVNQTQVREGFNANIENRTPERSDLQNESAKHFRHREEETQKLKTWKGGQCSENPGDQREAYQEMSLDN